MDVTAPVLPSTTVHPSTRERAGDGSAVQRALPLPGRGLAGLDPFLLLDHVPPATFGPAASPRGAGPHPHKGCETVTLLYQGDLRHRDSAGNAGRLDAGDVQWVTAGNGVVREESHGPRLTAQGGVLELVRLWVNLPARHKRAPPRHTDLRAASFPLIPLTTAGANFVRLVAGAWEGYTGPARTHTPLTVADVYLEAGIETTVALDAHWHTGIYLMSGGVEVDGQGVERYGIATVRDETRVRIKAFAASHVLFLSGLPIGEPIASSGPFVMNTEEEVRVALREHGEGLYGRLP